MNPGPRPDTKRPTVFCVNGEDCAAPGIEGPAPLGPGKVEGDECYRCEESDRLRLTPAERRRARGVGA